LQINEGTGPLNAIYLDSARADVVGYQELSSDFSASVYPNPATDYINVNLKLKKETLVKIELIDQSGRNIDILLKEECAKGNHKWKFSLAKEQNLNGIYFLRITEGAKSFVKKIALKTY